MSPFAINATVNQETYDSCKPSCPKCDCQSQCCTLWCGRKAVKSRKHHTREGRCFKASRGPSTPNNSVNNSSIDSL